MTAELPSRLRYVLAALSAAAGVTHVLAVGRHTEHWRVMAFFVVVALCQFAWAGYVAVATRRTVLVAGLVGNALVVATWFASRTTGVPIHPGIGVREPVGGLDVTATLLEIAIIALLAGVLAPKSLPRIRINPRELVAAGMAAGLVVVALPPVLGTPIGGTVVHSHIAGAHAQHGTHLLALGHAHGPAHNEQHARHAAGHAHDAAAHATHEPHAGAPHQHQRSIAASPAVQQPPLRGIKAVVRYGPFTLGPAKADGAKTANPAASNIIRTKLATPCSNCYLTAMEPDLVYADGSEANFNTGTMLHHAVVGDSAQPDATCSRNSTIGWMGRRFFASGNERTKGIFPAPFGYRVGSDDWWTGIFEIMNFRDVPQTVYFTMTVHYLPSSDTTVEPVTPVWLDVGNCRSSEYSIPAGHSETSWDWRSQLTGRVVFVGGHVHNWGRKISLTNATTNEHMCKSVAGYGTKPAYQGNIESMTSCAWDRLGTVRAGETLSITAVYDAPEARDDVMGIMLAYVYETSDLGGGTTAPDSVKNPPDSGGASHPSHNH